MVKIPRGTYFTRYDPSRSWEYNFAFIDFYFKQRIAN